ncbi:hypothetical protein ACLOJK_011019 [Asimina triloba]
MDEVITAADASASRSGGLSVSSSTLATNLPLFSAFLAFATAQFLKLFTTWYKEKRWDSKRLLGSGGMPSSHSATVTALTVAIGLREGTGGSSFALAVVLAAVVMYDATGVRLHAGRQAEVRSSMDVKYARVFDDHFLVSQLLEYSVRSGIWDVETVDMVSLLKSVFDLFKKGAYCTLLKNVKDGQVLNQIVCELPPEHPLSNVRPLREPLGHTPLQTLKVVWWSFTASGCAQKCKRLNLGY